MVSFKNTGTSYNTKRAKFCFIFKVFGFIFVYLFIYPCRIKTIKYIVVPTYREILSGTELNFALLLYYFPASGVSPRKYVPYTFVKVQPNTISNKNNTSKISHFSVRLIQRVIRRNTRHSSYVPFPFSQKLKFSPSRNFPKLPLITGATNTNTPNTIQIINFFAKEKQNTHFQGVNSRWKKKK